MFVLLHLLQFRDFSKALDNISVSSIKDKIRCVRFVGENDNSLVLFKISSV